MCEIAYLATDFKIGSQLHDGQWRPTHLKIGRISYLVATNRCPDTATCSNMSGFKRGSSESGFNGALTVRYA